MERLEFYRIGIGLLVVLFTTIGVRGQILVQGRVVDQKGPLVGASVVVEGLNIGTSSREGGHFDLSLGSGKYYLRVSFTGYKMKRIPVVVNKPIEISVLLEEDTKELEEVVVSGQSPEKNYQSLEIGVTRLNMTTLKKLPTFMGEVDILKSVLTLPGVTTVGEGTSDVNVRGGSADQNLILMDAAPIFNPSHLMGLFSIFNADVVDNLEFYRAAIPSKFGERASSVMDISLRQPDMTRWNVKAGIGLIASRLAVDGPIVKDKLSLLVGARASFPDYLFRLTKVSSLRETKAHFTDLTTKLSFTPNTRNRFFVSTYRSNDAFKVASDSLAVIEINASSSEFVWQTQTISGGWVWAISDVLHSVATVAHTQYNSEISSPDEQNAFSLKSSVVYDAAKTDFNLTLGRRHLLNFGTTLIRYGLEPGELTAGSPVSNINPKDIEDMKGMEGGIYLADEFVVNSKLSLSGGLRYSHFRNLGPSHVYIYKEDSPKNADAIVDTAFVDNGKNVASYGGFEPRIAVKVALPGASSLKFGYSRMRQYIQRLTNSTASLPTDRWQICNRYLKPQIVDQASLGYFRNFSSNMFEGSVEVFYKSFTNMTDYKEGVNFLLSTAIEADVLQGKGRSYGVEMQVKKSRGRLTGWLNYTYSQTRVKIDGEFDEEKISGGNWYPASYNKPHVLNLALNYAASKAWMFGFNFTYSSGRPITYPESKYFIGNLYIPNFIARNNSKIPDYHRLDLSVTYTPSHKKQTRYKSSWAFSVYNCYARKNAYSVFFKPNNQNRFQYSKTVNTYKLSIFATVFPSITYNFNF